MAGWRYIEGSYRKGPIKGVCNMCRNVKAFDRGSVYEWHPAIQGWKEGDQSMVACEKHFHMVWAGEN